MGNVFKISMATLLTFGAIGTATFLPWIMLAMMPILIALGAGPMVIYTLLYKPGGIVVLKSRKRVLVLDDDPVSLTFMKRALESMGYATGAYEKPDEALKAAKRIEFDYAIVDQVMPDLSGEDFILKLDAQLEESRSPIRPDVLIFTGFPDRVHLDESQLHHMKFHGVLRKEDNQLSFLRKVFHENLGMAA